MLIKFNSGLPFSGPAMEVNLGYMRLIAKSTRSLQRALQSDSAVIGGQIRKRSTNYWNKQTNIPCLLNKSSIEISFRLCYNDYTSVSLYIPNFHLSNLEFLQPIPVEKLGKHCHVNLTDTWISYEYFTDYFHIFTSVGGNPLVVKMKQGQPVIL